MCTIYYHEVSRLASTDRPTSEMCVQMMMTMTALTMMIVLLLKRTQCAAQFRTSHIRTNPIHAYVYSMSIVFGAHTNSTHSVEFELDFWTMLQKLLSAKWNISHSAYNFIFYHQYRCIRFNGWQFSILLSFSIANAHHSANASII